MLILVLFGLNDTSKGQTTTITNGLIIYNTTWSDPIYIVQDDIIIAQNCTLTINAGVKVFFDEDNYGLKPNLSTGIFVNGSLQINGAQNSMVQLTAFTISTGWDGIVFHEIQNNPHSDIKYAIIEYVKKTGLPCGPSPNSDGAIFINDFNNITIENCIIRNNSIEKRGGGLFISMNNGISSGSISSTVNILNNQIYNNTTKKGGGICVYTKDPSIRAYAYIKDNTIFNNNAKHSGGGISLLRYADADIIDNSITNNISECLNPNSLPSINGGGGLVIGFDSKALIIGNTITENKTFSFIGTNAKTGLGGGVLVRLKSESIFENNLIHSNEATYGGGIAITNGAGVGFSGGPSKISLSFNSLEYNSAIQEGGGIYILHSYGILNNNSINSNSTLKGGGIYLNSSTDINLNSNNPISIHNNRIFNNNAGIGGGIYAEGTLPTPPATYNNYIDIYNNLIYENITSHYAASVYIESNMIFNFNNNTVCDNQTTFSTSGDGVYISASATNNNLSFVNNILFYNGFGQNTCQVYHPNFIQYEFHENNIMNLGCGIPPDHNYDLMPEFVDHLYSDYRLLPSSPIIDLGLNSAFPVSNEDMNGQIRINGIIDIGAYEFWTPPIREMHLDSSKLYDIIIYPNPVSNKIFISNKSENNIVQLSVISSNGQLIYKKSFLGSKKDVSCDVQTLKCGVYILIIKTDKEIISHKFIKN